MIVKIQLKSRIDQTTGDEITPEGIEILDVQEIHLNFEKQVMTVRYSTESGGARSSVWGEYSLSDIESYDWDEFSYQPIPNDAISQMIARTKTERAAEENREILESLRTGVLAENSVTNDSAAGNSGFRS